MPGQGFDKARQPSRGGGGGRQRASYALIYCNLIHLFNEADVNLRVEPPNSVYSCSHPIATGSTAFSCLDIIEHSAVVTICPNSLVLRTITNVFFV